MTTQLKQAAVLAACLAALTTTTPGYGQDLSSSISCLRGTVPASQYAEFGEKLEEFFGGKKAGVNLVSSGSKVQLRVLDENRATVCDQEASNSTSCKLRLDVGHIDEFTVIVDNVENEQEITYRICAY